VTGVQNIFSLTGSGKVISKVLQYKKISRLPDINSFLTLNSDNPPTAESIYSQLNALEKNITGLYIPDTGTFVWSSHGEVVILTMPTSEFF
jgi:hypothetical protein